MDADAGAAELIEGIQNAHIEESSFSESVAVSDHVDHGGNDHGSGSSSELFDIDGVRFDSGVHCADENGNPVRTKLGRFRKRAVGSSKPADKKAEKSASVRSVPKPRLVTGREPQASGDIPNAEIPGAAPQEIEGRFLAAAHTATEIYIQTGVCIFGTEWLPNAATGDREAVVRAFGLYLQSKNIDDIPPGVALIVALVGYASPRFYKPKTSEKIQLGWTWLKIKIDRVRNRDASRADLRADRVRQNEAGETSSSAGASRWYQRSSA